MADKLRLEAAERYAEKNGMTIHEVYEDTDFKSLWNIFRNNPNSKVARRALGITQRRLQKESANESESFRSIQSIWRHPIKVKTVWGWEDGYVVMKLGGTKWMRKW